MAGGVRVRVRVYGMDVERGGGGCYGGEGERVGEW